MIRLEGVSKWYPTTVGRHWVLRDITLNIPPCLGVGILGGNGSGKSTLLRLIGGSDFPDRGQVRRPAGLSWPLGLSGGFQGRLTGRENSLFVCRIHGSWTDQAQRLAFIRDFSELGEYFDMPVQTYSSGMRSRLAFAISMAFEFSCYLIDEITAVGDASFKAKCKTAFAERRSRAGVIMVSHSLSELARVCQAGILLRQGTAQWFDDINDAIGVYHRQMRQPDASQ